MDITAQMREDAERRERCARLGEVIARAFDPDQPRDPDGKFASGGASDSEDVKPGDRVLHLGWPKTVTKVDGNTITAEHGKGKSKTETTFQKSEITTKLAPLNPNDQMTQAWKLALKKKADDERSFNPDQRFAPDQPRALCPACDCGDCVRHQPSIAALGGELMALRGWISWSSFEARFDPDQPRDPAGKWTSGGGEAPADTPERRPADGAAGYAGRRCA